MTKKKLIICLLFLLLGCKRVDSNNNYIEYVNDCLNDKKITNSVSLGYKYYIPRGIKKIYDYDYNQVFLNKNTKIYLYVDIISYYHKKELVFQKDNSYYFEKFNYEGNGYLKIEEIDDLYFVTMVYNYGKIEFYSEESLLNENIILSTILLNSIEYNDNIIEKILDGDFGEFSDFKYELDKPENASSNFSQYLEEYVQREEDEAEIDEILPDE